MTTLLSWAEIHHQTVLNQRSVAVEVATVIEKGALGPGEAASQIAKALSYKARKCRTNWKQPAVPAH